jgi:hypothetical protein
VNQTYRPLLPARSRDRGGPDTTTGLLAPQGGAISKEVDEGKRLAAESSMEYHTAGFPTWEAIGGWALLLN